MLNDGSSKNDKGFLRHALEYAAELAAVRRRGKLRNKLAVAGAAPPRRATVIRKALAVVGALLDAPEPDRTALRPRHRRPPARAAALLPLRRAVTATVTATAIPILVAGF